MTIVCGNTFYHAGSILLLQTGLLPQNISPFSDSVVSIGSLPLSFPTIVLTEVDPLEG